MTYFDLNATAPLLPVAREAWLAASEEHWQNPSSPYRQAARAREALEEERASLAAMLGAEAEDIVFNSGATEGNNGLLEWFAQTYPTGVLAYSAVEHPCVREAARKFFGDRAREIRVEPNGQIDLEALQDLLEAERVALVSVMAANNETGVKQPWLAVRDMTREAGAPLHVDAAQVLGKTALGRLGEVDLVTGCAHKFGGPKGVGFVKLSPGYRGYRSQVGGEQEHSHRGGTENLPGVAAMLAALRERVGQVAEQEADWRRGRDAFEKQLSAGIGGTRINGAGAPRLGNTSSLIMPRFANHRWVLKLDRLGFALSTGSACATAKEGPSHVLHAMGLTNEEAKRTVRVSANFGITHNEWDALADAFAEVWGELRAEESQSTSKASVIEI